MVNLSARKFYFEINEVDYTNALIEAKLNDSAWDESGEIATILEAKLWLPQGGADPLRNSDLQHGSEVIIKVADDTGVISASERDRTLYVSRINFQESTQICSLTACDLLTWNNWEEEIDDKDVEEILVTLDAFDNGIQHAQLANQFLAKRGFRSGRVDTWSINYRINYPISPDTWVSAAREIAASALGYVWIAPDGETEIRQISITRTPAFHLAIDECDSERLSQEVTPTEKIIAVCNQPIVSRREPTAPNTWIGHVTVQPPYEEEPRTYQLVTIDISIDLGETSGYLALGGNTVLEGYYYYWVPGYDNGTLVIHLEILFERDVTDFSLVIDTDENYVFVRLECSHASSPITIAGAYSDSTPTVESHSLSVTDPYPTIEEDYDTPYVLVASYEQS